MKNVLLIHGFNGIPKVFNYFKEELENKGYNVLLPNFPVREEITIDILKYLMNIENFLMMI